MFAYCGNNPAVFHDIAGNRPKACPISDCEIDGDECDYGMWFVGCLGIDGTSALAPQTNPPVSPINTSAESAFAKVAAAAGTAAMIGSCFSPAAYPGKRAENEKQEQYSYWTATRVKNKVIIGDPLTFTEALITVSTGGSIMCKNQLAALAIVKIGQYRNAVGPEISNGEGFYWHYHLTRNHTGTKESIHIWFYGDAITIGFFKLGD